MNERLLDAIVIGGGPAGSAAAATLGREGRTVVVCEQEAFPRFHIGESLLPAGNHVLAAIGAWEKIEAAGFIRKSGADFETADGSVHVHNYFAEGLERAADYTYQVERSRFDQLLLEHARESGARLLQPVRVTGVAELDDGGWRVRLGNGESLRSRFLIDASGRKTLLARHQRISRMPLPYERKLAVYGHFSGVRRAAGERGGNIVITRWRDGWFWQIPLDAERTSVGVVSPTRVYQQTRCKPEVFFDSVVAATPLLAGRMREAELQGGFHVTADYTYAYQRFAGDRFLLAGDAACFIDPIFSSGVCLALKSGHAAGKAVASALQAGQNTLPRRVQRHYTRSLQGDVAVMRGLIDNFYDRRGVEVFLRPSSKWQIFEAINSIVGGRTQLSWALRWRYQLFCLLSAWHRRMPLVEKIPDQAFGDSLPEGGKRGANS